MANKSNEYNDFTAGIRKILQANPTVVKAAMEEEKKEREKARKTKRASVSRASDARKS